MMKVLMVDALVGNEYQTCLCSGLKNAGLDIELVTTKDKVLHAQANFPALKWAPPKGGDGSGISKTIAYFSYLFKLYRYIRKENIDTVHFQFFRRERFESLYFMLLRLLGIRLVYTAHNILPHENSKIDYYLKWLVYKSANQIIVHSQYIKNKLVKHFPIPAQKVSIAPHGNFDIYQSGPLPTKKAARQKLGLSERDNVLLFFGYIREYKGLDLLINAFNKAAAKKTRLKLVIAGSPQSDALKKRYQEMIDNSPAKANIMAHFKFIENEMIPAYFAAADAVTLPYKHIDHSGIVHLAYTFGKPIIATDVGDFSETIENGQSGYIVEKNSTDALANAISKAFASKKALNEMGRYAKNLSKTKYSWDDIARKTIRVYQGVCGAEISNWEHNVTSVPAEKVLNS